MIYVTQGHEKGIGLEIFLKSFLMLSRDERKQIKLITVAQDLKSNLNDLKLEHALFKELQVIEVENKNVPSSSSSLLKALEVITPKDILVTLPTSKDQLKFNGQSYAGYTELFRAYFKNSNIAMTFKGIKQDVVLVTDHVALSKVTSVITKDLIVDKVKTTLEFFQKYFYNFEEVIFAGINPHVGENGILGNEDQCIYEAIEVLKKNSSLKFKGPFSGDTLHTQHNENVKQLFVYMFHDQGLAPFKSKFGFVGLNISMGLPFLRLSVDHGTAFDLYGKNQGDITGCLHLLKTALEVNHHVNQRN